jgi:regulator of replication initiation timing
MPSVRSNGASDIEIDHLRQVARRLSEEVYFLKEENETLRQRIVYLCRELEEARAKIAPPPFRASAEVA